MISKREDGQSLSFFFVDFIMNIRTNFRIFSDEFFLKWYDKE